MSCQLQSLTCPTPEIWKAEDFKIPDLSSKRCMTHEKNAAPTVQCWSKVAYVHIGQILLLAKIQLHRRNANVSSFPSIYHAPSIGQQPPTFIRWTSWTCPRCCIFLRLVDSTVFSKYSMLSHPFLGSQLQSPHQQALQCLIVPFGVTLMSKSVRLLTQQSAAHCLALPLFHRPSMQNLHPSCRVCPQTDSWDRQLDRPASHYRCHNRLLTASLSHQGPGSHCLAGCIPAALTAPGAAHGKLPTHSIIMRSRMAHTCSCMLMVDGCLRLWQEDVADKLQLVAIYNARLTQREYRRAFILERGLLNVKRFQVGLENPVPDGAIASACWHCRLERGIGRSGPLGIRV